MTRRPYCFSNSSFQMFMAVLFFMNCNAQDTSQQNIIARIDGKYTISFGDIQQYVHDSHLIYRYRANKANAYHRALDDKIVNQLKLIDFFALGLNDKGELIQGIRREFNEELVIEYYRTQFYHRYVNEDSIRSAYKKLGREVIYQQIVLAKPKNASQKDLASLKSLANSIKTEILNGTDFAELAKKYSQEVGSSRSGDFMPPLNWTMSLSSKLNHTIFHLAANEVQIIETGESINIVKVAKVRRRDIQPYESAKEDIRKTLDQRYADFSYQEFERTKKNLVDETTVQWNPKAVLQLVRWSNIPKFYETCYSDTLRYAISQGKNLLVLKHSAGKVDLKEYLRLLNDVLIWGKIASVNEDDVKKFILEAVRSDRIVKKARELDLEKNIFNPRTTNPILRNEIFRLYDRHVIEAQIPKPTEKALRDFYQANEDSMFYQLAKVNIYAVIDSSKKVIDEAKHKLEQNVPFEKLAPEIFVKTYVRGRDGTLDTYLVDEPPYFGEAAFRLGLYETAGPIEYNDREKGRQYALIKCMGIREERQLSYKDVEKTITDEFTKYHREEITKATQNHLRKKYTVTVYKDVFDQLLASIGINPQS